MEGELKDYLHTWKETTANGSRRSDIERQLKEQQQRVAEKTQTLQQREDERKKLLAAQTELLRGVESATALFSQVKQVEAEQNNLIRIITHSQILPTNSRIRLLVEAFSLTADAKTFHTAFFQLLHPFLSVFLCPTYAESQVGKRFLSHAVHDCECTRPRPVGPCVGSRASPEDNFRFSPHRFHHHLFVDSRPSPLAVRHLFFRSTRSERRRWLHLLPRHLTLPSFGSHCRCLSHLPPLHSLAARHCHRRLHPLRHAFQSLLA